ncbi:MAG: hypothetical protein KBT29_01465 [Prevotellaceae bacterium]|nr:hypothetical protein [Candidatus Minthosoma caballi]
MIKNILTIVSFFVATTGFAQNDAWSKVTNWNKYFENDLENIVAYALYDIDGDGINEAFVRDEANCYGCLSCGGGEIKAVTNSIMTTDLYYCKGIPYVIHKGGCGTGCFHKEICKIEKSKLTTRLLDIAYYGPEGQEEHECSTHKTGEDKDISYAQFQKLAPKLNDLKHMTTLKWIPVTSVSNTPKAAPTSDLATLHAVNGDTVIIKDSKGYLYQIMSDASVGVAPGGAYSGDIVIPSQIKYEGRTRNVTTVRRGAMWKKEGTSNIGNITSITLPETVTLVGADAFRGNANLTAVNYSDKTRIEVRSFWGCPKLQIEQNEPAYAFTEPTDYSEENSAATREAFTRMYYPTEEPDMKVSRYNWAFFKYNHSGIAFDSWKNFDSENAMACFCWRIKNVKSGLFRLLNPDNVEPMFKGYLEGSENVMLADNNYVATHEFPMFSRWIWGEQEKSMPKTFVAAMEKKYGRKAKYSYECGKLLYSTNEQLAITEFVITNHECMYVLSWLKDGKEVCSYMDKRPVEPGYEEFSVWNVDDEGDYGIPNIMTIARDEKGNIELFLFHGAPESFNFMHLAQRGNKFEQIGDDHWYNWIDSPE